MTKRKKIPFYAWWVYSLFEWVWNPIFATRPDLVEVLIAALKSYQIRSPDENYAIAISILRVEDND